jgi:hypothetical protein
MVEAEEDGGDRVDEGFKLRVTVVVMGWHAPLTHSVIKKRIAHFVTMVSIFGDAFHRVSINSILAKI